MASTLNTQHPLWYNGFVLRTLPLPPGVPEALLLIVILAAIIGVVALVRRRRRFAIVTADAELPNLVTQQRVVVTFRRVYRDPAQGVWLAETTMGKGGRRKLIFCLTDYEQNQKRYDESLGKTQDIALYGMATLAPGGAEVIRDQIRDADKITEDAVRLLQAGQFANDYVVIGRIVSLREETVNNIPVNVYRVQVIRADDFTLVLELATDRDASPPLPDDSMTHGASRLYGYFAS